VAAAVALILFVAVAAHCAKQRALEGWPLVDELAILLPVIAPLPLSAVLYRLTAPRSTLRRQNNAPAAA
jgi:hypothetical protein